MRIVRSTPKVKPSERQRFEELGLLGEGGMGEVVLAMDHDIARQVSLKRLPENCDLGRVLRFAEEIRTVGQLEHPNIVPVHDVGVDSAGRYYFVMKHLRGETLESIIARLKAGDAAAHARFTMEVRIQIFLSVLNAMAYAHQQGFIHRDLKPANIMVGPYGEVTVMDWGLAKRIRGAEQTPELPMTRVQLTTAAGASVTLGAVARDTAAATIRVPVRAPLAPGAYTVHWSTMSDDGHAVRGSYAFAVGR